MTSIEKNHHAMTSIEKNHHAMTSIENVFNYFSRYGPSDLNSDRVIANTYIIIS